ncbi:MULTISPECIES: FxSxx-COOH system tetratricopeptide repeat protein [Micromonospora]|uniref:TIR domain-containing protein n=1 Tax=Micromonospora solifontis TaxID=2487138 RepID=A0ABX9WBI5_9ACTN|nr:MULTISPECIES: FxSxx-COOH system tetratricopeptide repeat protein [Micromonospora]NES12985.1 tetratricopeptide repeat protein [Micromonospora sp. PPF5-17B]NES38626.1 tetratricopeptide repeat protein [Micromonospora solifontis]NES54910.1 tetratricopeptide repeat protein [Micromonospora sp. PPF5-6]RNL94439.1 TIR domain-containing protein [Micromonospora solifontis]
MGTEPAGGRIVTFYSYKGGTGRSMALANIAWILASNGHRVLMVDWDLEAPGLHRYFHPFLPDKELGSTSGLMDVLWSYATNMVDSSRDDREQWRKEHADVLEHVVSLRWPFPDGGVVDLLPAGQQDRSYATRVMSFDWENFYDRLHGGSFIEEMKRSMRRHYDYVLIDSRTGLNDTSGICTVQLPDTLVMCFTLNDQSIAGALAVTESVRRQRGGQDLRILPVPCRVEDGESTRLEAARRYVRHGFRRFLSDRSAEERDRYWGDVEIPYKIFYAYEEILASVGDRPHQEGSLLAAYERLTAHLTDGRVREVVPLGDADREMLIKRFWRQTVGSSLYDFFISHDHSDQRWAEWIAAQLEQAGYRVWVRSWDVRPGARWSEEIERAVLSSDVTLALLSPASVRSSHVQQEWQLARDVDPGGEAGRLVPIQVVECVPPPAFGDLNGIRLVGSDEGSARRRLLSAIQQIQPPASGYRHRLERHFSQGFPGLPPKIANLPPRPRELLGRDQEIFELWSGFQVPRSRTQVVCGLAGVGKTALAAEFAHRFAHQYDLVWWTSAGTPEDLARGMSKLAAALDLPAERVLDTPTAELLSELGRRRSLLILDGIEERHDVFEEAPAGVDVLVTSRRQGWGPAVAEHLLAALPTDEAVALLRGIEPDLSEQAARDIAGRVAGLPLALTMVASDPAAAVQVRGDSRRRWWDRGTHGFVLAVYWEWARVRLQVEAPAGVELLRILAFFAPEPVPLSLFVDTPAVVDHPDLRASMAYESSFAEVLGALRGYSLVERTDEHLQVHPLVQAAVREDLTAAGQEAFRRQGERLLVSARLGDPADPRSWPRYRQLLPHVLAADWVRGPALRALVLLLCGYLSASGQVERARTLADTIVERFTALLGAEHRDTASGLHVLAGVTWEAGDREEACDLANRAWEVRRQLLGAEHRDTLASLNNLAVMLWSVGKRDEALAQNELLLSERRELLGPDHPDTLVALGNRATMLYGLGRLDEALHCEQTVHDKRRRSLSPHHPVTLVSLGNIATLLESMGRTAEAAMTYGQLADGYGATLGEDHPDTLRARFLLSRARLEMGDTPGARQLLTDTLARQQRLLGREHPEVEASRLLLAELAAAHRE